MQLVFYIQKNNTQVFSQTEVMVNRMGSCKKQQLDKIVEPKSKQDKNE